MKRKNYHNGDSAESSSDIPKLSNVDPASSSEENLLSLLEVHEAKRHKQRSQACWHKNYLLLIEFKIENGHCRPKRSSILGDWVKYQRKHYKRGTLIKDRKQKLNAIGFEWNLRESCWQNKYILLAEFKKQHGHCRPDRSTSLGAWVKYQRKHYKRGSLSKDRKQKLNAIGFEWVLCQVGAWEDNYQLLVEFKKEHGHCQPDRSTSLGAWASTQHMNNETGFLNHNQKQKLNAIGFDWDAYESVWKDNYQLLVEFKKEHGHSQPNQSTSLGAWASSQHMNNETGCLSMYQTQKLNDIGFDWDAYESVWKDNYQLLVEFKKEHGHSQPNQSTSLGGWVSAQRMNHAAGCLSEYQTQKLNAIGFDWDAYESVWQDNYRLLVEFKKEHGHSQPNQSTSLGGWVSTQRMNHAAGCLSQYQKQKMNSIDFEWQRQIHRCEASDYDSQRSDDNDLPQQQQTSVAMMTTDALNQPITPTPQEMDDGNSDSNICEEFKETVTYGDSEYWI